MKYDKKTIAVQWHITDKCQKKCLHCYMGEKTCNEMAYDQVEIILADLLEYAQKNNVYYEFYITGGDPLLHSQFSDILRLFHERNLSVSIMCNPESINEKSLKELSEFGVNSIQFSIDGMKEIHDTIRGKKSFDYLINAIKLTNKTQISTALMFTLYRLNSEDLFEAMEFANELQVDRFSFDLGISIGSAVINQLEMMPRNEIFDVLKRYISLKKEIKARGSKTFFEEKCNLINAVRISQGEFFCPEEEAPYIFDGCQIGVSDFVIDVNGDVLGCRRLGNESFCGNLLKTSFEEIWCDSPFLVEQRNKALMKAGCRECVARSWCQGCEAYERALSKNGLGRQVICGQTLFEKKISQSSQGESLCDTKKIRFLLQDDSLKLVDSDDFKKEYVRILFGKERKRDILENYMLYSTKYGVSTEIARLLFYFFVLRFKA